MDEPDGRAVQPPEDGPSRGADEAEMRGERPPEDEGKERRRRRGKWWKRAAAVSLLALAAFLAGRFGCGGGDVFAAGRKTPPEQAARMAAESGLPVRLVYEPDARTGAEDALLRALERTGVKVSETVRKD